MFKYFDVNIHHISLVLAIVSICLPVCAYLPCTRSVCAFLSTRLSHSRSVSAGALGRVLDYIMKILVIIALYGLMIGVVFGLNQVCPARPSWSVLDTPVTESDCDICEKLTNSDTEVYQKCGTYMESMILEKLVKDCKRILKTGKQTQIQWFWKDLNIICKAKSGLGSAYIEFDPPTCECDPCVELAKTSSEFMQVCAPQMSESQIAQTFGKCRQVKNDYEDLWNFYQDLKEQCYNLTGKNPTFPLCECDVCWLLFDENSDFMKKCGSRLDQTFLKWLMSSCEKVMCDPAYLARFKLNLELICKMTHNVTFDFPRCACEECWLIFQTDSDFMQKCGSGLSKSRLFELMGLCYTNIDNLDNFMSFLDDLEVVCHSKGYEYFAKEMCRCVDCLLIEDPTREIWQDCIRHLGNYQRMEFRHQCLNASNNENALEQFKQDLIDFCLENQGANVKFPSCDCVRQDLCVEFVVDRSGSVSGVPFKLELGFVRDIVQAFGNNIGPGKTQIGLISFDGSPHLRLSLCNSTDQAGVELAINSTLAIGAGGSTDIAAAIDSMRNDMQSCCTGDNREKFAIVITDGQSYLPDIQTAVNNTPNDITIIAVGFGNTDAATLKAIARNIEENVYLENGPEDLSSLVEDLKSHIGC